MAISVKMKSFVEKSSWIRKMSEEGNQLKQSYGTDNVFDFSFGNPDAPPPKAYFEVIDKVISDSSPGVHGYMLNAGYMSVREVIATHLSQEQKVNIVGSDVLLTCGTGGGLNVILKSILNPGEEVIVLAPHSFEYALYIDNHGGIMKVVQTDPEFNIDLEAIRKAVNARTKAVIINSPNNPTGQIYSARTLSDLGNMLTELSGKFGSPIYLLSDTPCRKLIFNSQTVPSIFTAYKNSIIASSYSQDLSLPGERIGYLAVHPEIEGKIDLLNAMTLAHRILGFINAPALLQRVVAELQDASVDISVYARRKELFCKILKDGGFTFTEPKGAFYIFPKTPIEDDVKFVALLQEERILAIPGRNFGAPGHIRLAFCVPDQVIVNSAEGFKRAFTKAKQQ